MEINNNDDDPMEETVTDNNTPTGLVNPSLSPIRANNNTTTDDRLKEIVIIIKQLDDLATRMSQSIMEEDEAEDMKDKGLRYAFHLNYQRRISGCVATNADRIKKALAELTSAMDDSSGCTEEDFHLRMKELEDFIRWQRSLLRRMCRRWFGWNPFFPPPGVVLVGGGYAQNLSRRSLAADGLSLRVDSTSTADNARVSSAKKLVSVSAAAVAEEERGGRGGPMRRQRQRASGLIDVNKMVDNLRDLTL